MVAGQRAGGAWSGWPEPLRDDVPVNATVPAVAPDEVEGVLARFPGCRTAKVKVAEPGQTLADDIGRVAAVRMRSASDVAVRVDANGGWDVDDRGSVAALAVLGRCDLRVRRAAVPRPSRSWSSCGPGSTTRASASRWRPTSRHPQGRRPARGRGRRRRRRRRGQGRAARRGAARAGHRRRAGPVRGLPVVVSSRAGHLRRHRRRDRRWPPRCRCWPSACGLGTIGLLSSDVTAAPAPPGRRAAAGRAGRAGRRPAGLARRRARAPAVVARAGASLPRGAAGPLVRAAHGGRVTGA